MVLLLIPEGWELLRKQKDSTGLTALIYRKHVEDCASGSPVRFSKELPFSSELRLGPLSPDGRLFISYNGVENTAKEERKLSWNIYSALDGRRRTVLAEDLSLSHRSLFVAWSADSRSLLIWKDIGNGQSELRKAFLDGSSSKRIILQIDGTISSAAEQPDGTRIAFSIRKPLQSQIWAMENFLPPAKKHR